MSGVCIIVAAWQFQEKSCSAFVIHCRTVLCMQCKNVPNDLQVYFCNTSKYLKTRRVNLFSFLYQNSIALVLMSPANIL